MKLRNQYTCPLELTHDITKGKWKPIILWQLGKGRMSLSQLERDIKNISQKMLLEQLNGLREYGIVEKRADTGYPLKVEYSMRRKPLATLLISKTLHILVQLIMRDFQIQKRCFRHEKGKA